MLAKKPSVDRVYLSWMFAPSTVIDIALCGRPLTVDERCEWLDADVSTPGRNTTKFSALRVMSGKRRNLIDADRRRDRRRLRLDELAAAADFHRLRSMRADFERDLHRARRRRSAARRRSRPRS